MKPGTSFISGLLAGVAIGGVIALLFAPKSGKETREQIKQKLQQLEDDFEVLKQKSAGKASQLKQDIADKIAELKREMESYSNS